MDNALVKKFYVTTPIYYPSGEPHLGHSYCSVAADVLARYHRLLGEEVFFLTGTDEHGQKIENKAKNEGITPKEYVDSLSQNFKDLWKTLCISYNKFIRTTDDDHKQSVQKIFTKLYNQGDIYKGYYKGLYCEPCEAFFTKTQVKEGNLCPDCGRKVEYTEEEAYFFKLSKYAAKILDLYNKNPDFVRPISCFNEMKRFVEMGLEDLCVSRTTFSWGIKVPFDEKHVVYVWLDALTNYITALGYGSTKDEANSSNFKKFWPADVHFVGKEIMRFHAVIWVAILMALDLPLPKCIFGHGWLLFKDGTKMSKSKGNVVSPLDLMNKYSVSADALRYFLLREFPFGNDGIFSFETFVTRINSDLANDLGNLVSRTISMILKFTESDILNPSELILEQEEKNIMAAIELVSKNYKILMNDFKFSENLANVWELVSMANRYIEKSMPWKLNSEKNTNKLFTVLYVLCEVIRCVSILTLPFMPQTSEKIFSQLGVDSENLKNYSSVKFHGVDKLIKYKANRDKEILFPRIEKV